MHGKHRYQGHIVTVIRSAHDGETGFDPSKEQVLIRFEDGRKKIVERSELIKV